MLLNFHKSKRAEIYPSPGLQKSRLLLQAPYFAVRGLLKNREGSGLPGASERGRGQAKVKPKAQVYRDRDCPDRASDLSLPPLPEKRSAQEGESADVSLKFLDMAQRHRILRVCGKETVKPFCCLESSIGPGLMAGE